MKVHVVFALKSCLHKFVIPQESKLFLIFDIEIPTE